ncbi:MAG: 6-pyruvoyl-tetrahydropterin synthase-related protein [Methylocystaceae bacterium]
MCRIRVFTAGYMVSGNGIWGYGMDNDRENMNMDNNETLTMTLRLMGFLNASHYAVFNGKRGQTHSHSWQLQFEVEVPVNGKGLVRFEDLEKLINSVLKPYQRTVLNDMEPFDRFQPFTENIAAHFFNLLADLLADRGSHLTKLVAWENPTKGVEVTQRIPYHLLAGQEPGLQFIPSATVPPTVLNDTDLPPAVMVNNEVLAELAASYDALDNETAEDELVQVEERETEPVIVAEDENPRPQITWWKLAIIIIVLTAAAIAAYYPVLAAVQPNSYPWGSDAWGHLYKAEFLTEQIKQGNYFPQFWATWYNGCQPFRYWAPLPYYSLAGLNFLTGNIFKASYYYIFLCALIGAFGWLMWRKRIPLGICMILAVIWLIWPDNVRVAFSEGNFPRVLSTALLPILVACYLNVLEKKKSWGYFVATVILVQLAVLCHAMMGAVDCVALFLATVFHWLYGGSSLKQAGRAIGALILGVLLSAWWLLPALSGGIVGMGSAASGGVFYLSFIDAFNPLKFRVDREFPYLGISLLPLMILMIVTWKQRPVWSRTLFTVGMLLIIISFPSFSWLHRLMPLSDMLWPFRFRSIASLMLLSSMAAVIAYPRIKTPKPVLQIIIIGLLLLVITDSAYAASKLIYPGQMPAQVLDVSKKLKAAPGWRVATLDISTLGSAPSLLFSVAGHREQVFGWAWQGATTANNIMLLNTAMEHKLYPFAIKQLYFLGATDVVANPYGIKSSKTMNKLMKRYGYQKVELTESKLSYWHGLNYPYFLVARPQGLAIGKFASMYAMQFPSLQIGNSPNIDDYHLSELKSYPLLILSGSSWRSRTAAEQLVIEYARQGGRVVVDLSGFPVDVFSKQPKFLNVYGQSVSLRGELNIESDKGEKVTWQPFDSNSLPWLTIVPLPLDKVVWNFNYMNSPAIVFGYKKVAGIQIGFVGANPIYHSFLTGDPMARKMLIQWLGISEDFEIPGVITVNNYQINKNGYTFSYTLPSKQRVVVPVALIDGLQAYIDGQKVPLQGYESLVSVELPAGSHILELCRTVTPIYWFGWMTAGMALLIIVILTFKNRKEAMN